MRNALLALGLVGLFATLAVAGPVPSSVPPVDELALAGFPALTVTDLVTGAQPRTTPIEHISPELFRNSVIVQSAADGGTLSVDGQKVPSVHLLPDAGNTAQAIEHNTVTLAAGTFTYTFAQPFTGVPVCVCSDTAATAAAASCNAATASNVVVKGGATAAVNVICIGAR